MLTKTYKLWMGALAALMILFVGLSALVPLNTVAAAAPDGRGRPGSGTGTRTTTPLSAVEANGLVSAILEEYKAMNLYQAAIAQIGNVAPFTQIVRSEQQHINALLTQASKYGVAAPSNPGLPSVQFASQTAACQAGVAAEIEDARLYDTLKAVTTHSDLLQVYSNLQNASLSSHLPAFQTCD